MKRSNLDRFGITFVEILMALVIIALGFLPLQMLFSESIDAAKEMKDYLAVMNICEAQIHRYISIVSNLTASDTISLQGEDLTTVVKNEFADKMEFLPNLKVLATVKLSPDTNGAGAYNILIEAKWGRDRKFHLFTATPLRDFVNSAEHP